VTEIHPWGVAPHQPATPEILIFDLDPEEGLPFARVIEAAKEMREHIEAVGLTAFIKTTGGKGLHVVTPVKGGKEKLAWPEAKEFARLLCEKMVANARDRYTTNMSKKLRKGRIFLDYLRNDRTATAVGPYSPRGRPGATVALPLKWSQVNSSLNPKDYSIATAKAFIRRGDPWKDIRKAAGVLSAARKKLDRM
jgi:bifunctional non-homologous end joining protein LigD